MSILNEIIEFKRLEVEEHKRQTSIDSLMDMEYFNRECISLKDRLKEKASSGIIAEFKRQSPSKGIINDQWKPSDVVSAYEVAGVAGSSVLTDSKFFGGSLKDLIEVRAAVKIPLLRKDFIIDEYQIIEAKAYGADVILLIAANLEKEQCYSLAKKAKSLGMEVLLEVHNEEELGHINEYVDIVGVNNRNLKTFEVSLNQSIELINKIPDQFAKISESGIKDVDDVVKLRDHGFNGFLIGENFMKTEDPGNACKEFILDLKSR